VLRFVQNEKRNPETFQLVSHGGISKVVAMTDWTKDEFMSIWDQKYVSTNVKSGSRPYDKDLFLGLESELTASQPELQDVAYTLIVRPP
jgi:hypothetical protein